MKIEPVVFLCGQGQQRFFDGLLDRAQHFPAGLLFFGPLLVRDDAKQFGLDRRQLRRDALIGFILNDPTAGARSQVEIGSVHQPLKMAAGPGWLVEFGQRRDVLHNPSAMAKQPHSVARVRTGQIDLEVELGATQASEFVQKAAFEFPRLNFELGPSRPINHADFHAGMANPIPQFGSQIPLDLFAAELPDAGEDPTNEQLRAWLRHQHAPFGDPISRIALAHVHLVGPAVSSS